MLASPARSAPAPYNYNQPCAGNQPCTGSGATTTTTTGGGSGSGGGGGGMAQLSIHGTADTVIAYHGGPRFHSPTFILMDEPASDALWVSA